MARSTYRADSDRELIFSTNAIPALVAPVIFVGYSLCLSVGFWSAVVVVAVGSFVLYKIALMIAGISVGNGLGTMDVIGGYFGEAGEKFCSFVIGGSYFGWFLWQLAFCTHFFASLAPMQFDFLHDISYNKVLNIFYIIFWLIALKGEKGIRFLSFLVVPLLIVLILSLVMLFPIHNKVFQFSELKVFNLSALAMFVNSFSTIILTTSTLYCFSSSLRGASKSIKLTYIFAIPFMSGLGIALGSMVPTQDLFDVFKQATGIWPALFAAYIFLGGLGMCVFNLHCGTDAVAYAFSLRSHTPVLVLMGFLGLFVMGRTSLGRVGPSELFQVMIAVIVAIVVVRASFSNLAFGRDQKYVQKANCQAMMWASAVGLIAQMGWIEVTGVPSFDAALVAFGLCIYFSRSRRKKARAQLL